MQKCVALSITEAEYIAAMEAYKEMLCFMHFLEELSVKQDMYVLFYDSQNAIDLKKNANYHAWANHIDVRYHWI